MPQPDDEEGWVNVIVKIKIIYSNKITQYEMQSCGKIEIKIGRTVVWLGFSNLANVRKH